MSDSTYTLKIEIDDSKIREIEKRLMNIVGGQGIGSKVTGAAGGGDIGKNIAKLGAIAVGVAGLVMLVQKIASMSIQASPMLQQMLKLINFGVLLILRPIGDFFGFFLRPLIIYFLRSIILPFYRLMRPIMQKFGTWLGLGAASNLKSNTDGIGAILAGDWEEVARLTKEGNEKILKSLEDAGKAWDTWILSLDLPAWGTIETTIEAWITDLGIKLPTWAGIKTEVETWITDLGIKLPTWAGIKTKIEAWITDMGIALPSWEDITSTIDSITSGVLGLAQALRDFIIDLATSFGIDLGWSDTPSPPPPPLPPTNGTENNNTNADIYPWLETPESRFSDSGKGGGR